MNTNTTIFSFSYNFSICCFFYIIITTTIIINFNFISYL